MDHGPSHSAVDNDSSSHERSGEVSVDHDFDVVSSGASVLSDGGHLRSAARLGTDDANVTAVSQLQHNVATATERVTTASQHHGASAAADVFCTERSAACGGRDGDESSASVVSVRAVVNEPITAVIGHEEGACDGFARRSGEHSNVTIAARRTNGGSKETLTVLGDETNPCAPPEAKVTSTPCCQDKHRPASVASECDVDVVAIPDGVCRAETRQAVAPSPPPSTVCYTNVTLQSRDARCDPLAATGKDHRPGAPGPLFAVSPQSSSESGSDVADPPCSGGEATTAGVAAAAQRTGRAAVRGVVRARRSGSIATAIRADDAFILERCYRQGMPLTARLHRQRTYLHMAANKGSPRCVTSLVRLAPELLAAVDDHNNPPLHVAVFHGQESAVKALLDNGADPSLPGGAGGTALHVALIHAKRDNATCMMYLLRAGVDVRRKSNDGRAAIHVAVVQEAQCTRDLVQTLLNYGAEVNHTSSHLDLFQVCCKMGNPSVAALIALHGGDMSSLLPPARKLRMSPAEFTNGRILRVKAEFLEKVRAELHQLCDVRYGMCPLTVTPTKPRSFAQAGAAMPLACIESLHPDVQKAIASVHDSDHRGSEHAVHDLRRCAGLFGYSETWVGTEVHPGWFAVGTGTVRLLHPTERGFHSEGTNEHVTAALKLELSSTLSSDGIDILWAAVWTWLALHPPTNLHPQGVSIEDVVPNDLPMVWFPSADDSALFARLTAAIAEGTRRAVALGLTKLSGDALWAVPAKQEPFPCVMLPHLPLLSKLLLLAAGDAPSASVFAPLSDSDALFQDHKAHVCGGTVLQSMGRQDSVGVTVATHLLACMAMEGSKPIPPAELDVTSSRPHEALGRLTVARPPPLGSTPRAEHSQWASRSALCPRPVWYPQSLWRCPFCGVDTIADDFSDQSASAQGSDLGTAESSSCGLVGVVPVGVIRNQYGNVPWSIKVTTVDAFRDRPEMVQSMRDLVRRNHELYQGTSLQNLNEVFEANAAVEVSTHHHTVEKGRQVGWSVKGYVAITVMKPEQREVYRYLNDKRIVENLKPEVVELTDQEERSANEEIKVPDLTPEMVDMSQPVIPKLRCSVFIDSCDSTPRQVGPMAMRMAFGLFSEIVGADRQRTLASDASAQGADIEHDWMLVTVFGQDAYLIRLMEHLGRLLQVAADIAEKRLPVLAELGRMGLRAVIAESELRKRPSGNDVTIGFMMPPLPAMQQLLLMTLSTEVNPCVPTPLPWQETPTATEVEVRAALCAASARAVLGYSVFDVMGKAQADEQDPKQWFDHRVAQSAAVPFCAFEQDDLERLRRTIFEKHSDARRKDPALPVYKRHKDMSRLFVIQGLHCNYRDTETSQRGLASHTPSLMVVYVLALWSRLGFVRRASEHSNKARAGPLPPMIPVESEVGSTAAVPSHVSSVAVESSLFPRLGAAPARMTTATFPAKVMQVPPLHMSEGMVEDTVLDLTNAADALSREAASAAGALRRRTKALWAEQRAAAALLREGVISGRHGAVTVTDSDVATLLAAAPLLRFLVTIADDATTCPCIQQLGLDGSGGLMRMSQAVLSAPVDPQLTGRELRLQTLALANLRRACDPSRAYLPAAVVEDLRAPAVNVVSWTRLPPSNACPEFLSAEEAHAAVLAVLNLVRSSHAAGFRLTSVASLVPAWEEHTAQFGGTTAGEATAHIVAFFRQQSALLAEGSAGSPAWLGWDGTGPVLAPPADVMFPATELRWSPPGPLGATADDDEVASPPLLEFTTAGSVGPTRGAPAQAVDAAEAAAAFFAERDTAAALRCMERIAEGARRIARP